VATQQTWTRGKAPRRTSVIRLTLTDVHSLRILLDAAGFAAGQHGRLVVTTDGATTVRLGSRSLHLTKGRHTVHFVG
jgi:hypothetical protein